MVGRVKTGLNKLKGDGWGCLGIAYGKMESGKIRWKSGTE